MSNFDLNEHLKQVQNRKAATTQKVDEAIKRLVRANENINFNSVVKQQKQLSITIETFVSVSKSNVNNKHNYLLQNK